jgi:hypothetical protein
VSAERSNGHAEGQIRRKARLESEAANFCGGRSYVNLGAARSTANATVCVDFQQHRAILVVRFSQFVSGDRSVLRQSHFAQPFDEARLPGVLRLL